jgi:hypothetical protein
MASVHATFLTDGLVETLRGSADEVEALPFETLCVPETRFRDSTGGVGLDRARGPGPAAGDLSFRHSQAN